VLRPLELDDAEALLALRVANREFIAPFDPPRPDEFFTLDGQLEVLHGVVERRAQGLGYGYAILDGGELVGTITLSNVVRGPFQSANVGYWVDRARNGQGIATRAVAAVVEVAFGELSLHRLEAGTLVDNLASQRVLEKNRFERFGLARNYLHVAGEWRDHVLFQRTIES
jgi:ribosomal-protein-alanine N-acetyltransferase